MKRKIVYRVLALVLALLMVLSCVWLVIMTLM